MLGSILSKVAIGPVVETALKGVVDRVIASLPVGSPERQRAELEAQTALAEHAGQIAEAVSREAEAARDMYLADAQSSDRLQRWWRPALGWAGGFLILWEGFLRQTANGIFGTTYQPMPDPVWDTLTWVLLGLIGVRSIFDKGGARLLRK